MWLVRRVDSLRYMGRATPSPRFLCTPLPLPPPLVHLVGQAPFRLFAHPTPSEPCVCFMPVDFMKCENDTMMNGTRPARLLNRNGGWKVTFSDHEPSQRGREPQLGALPRCVTGSCQTSAVFQIEVHKRLSAGTGVCRALSSQSARGVET